MSEKLPASERIDILTRRIERLNKGSGDYSFNGRLVAIRTARASLQAAYAELSRAA